MSDLSIKTDGSPNQNHYIDVENIRVTFVRCSSWATGHGIRIQAYRDGESLALHQGAELKLRSREQGFALIAAIAILLKNAGDEAEDGTP